MTAPSPVSAFLHSSALVAAGVYLIARFFPLLSHEASWSLLLIPSGVIGVLAAGLLALRQTEIKALLAYSTISQYGFIVLAFGLGSVTGAQAGLYAFFVHAFLKAGLFLVAGAVTHLSGETRFSALGGLFQQHPVLGVLGAILALSLGGVPLFGGFYYKEELLHAAYSHEAWLLLAAMLIGGMLSFLYMMRFVEGVFGGVPRQAPESRLPFFMGLPIALTALTGLACGLAPNWMNRELLDPAITSVVRAPTAFTVELHVGGVLALSLGVLAVGLVTWGLWSRGRLSVEWAARAPRRYDLGGARLLSLYDACSDWLLALHSGNLRRYLRAELLAALGLIALAWSRAEWGPGRAEAFDLPLALMLAICLLAAAATVWLRHHVVAVLALTISGYALAVVFALMHAPDVALAQVLVETLATFSIVLALRHSRQVHPERTHILTAGRRDWGRWLIALGFGASTGILAYELGRSLPADSAGSRYAAEGFALNGMHDLVTSILADFRALDTAIEILVFASAAYAILALFPRRSPEDEGERT